MAWPKGKPKSPLTRMRISQSKRKRTEPVKPPVVHVPTDRVSKLTPNAGKNVLELLPRPPLPPGLDDTPLPRRLVGTPADEDPKTEPITEAPRTRAYEVAPRRGR